MPDKRISELTAVVAPAGTDEFPCNQAGTTKKETRAQITAQVAADLAAHMASSPATHANNSITDALLRDSAGVSVIGRAAGAGGDPADIVAGADNTVLCRTGGTLSFQTVPTAAGDRVRTFFVPPHIRNDGTVGLIGVIGPELTDNQDCYAYGVFAVPADYVADMTIKALLITNGAGNFYGKSYADSQAIGEAYGTHQDGIVVNTAIALAANIVVVLNTITLASEAIGDVIRCTIYREASNVLDTLGANAFVMGWLVSYTADM